MWYLLGDLCVLTWLLYFVWVVCCYMYRKLFGFGVVIVCLVGWVCCDLIAYFGLLFIVFAWYCDVCL